MKPILVYPIIYVLELEESKYYVGITTNLNYRWAQHLAGDGAKWTRLYKPLRILEVHTENCDEAKENEITQAFCAKFGRENVRGGSWTKC